MYFHVITLGAIAAIFQSGYAAPSPEPRSPSSVSTQCYTRQATIPGPKRLSTSWSTLFTSCTSTSTSTVTTSTTLPGSTSTATVTTTVTITAPTSVSTATVTSTETDTATTTSSVTTTTTTSTTTTVTATSTVPTSSGFLPIQTSLPGASYDGSGGADPVNKRSSPNPRANRNFLQRPNPHQSLSSWKFPQAVRCYATQALKCSTTTSKTTITVTATSPATTVTTTSTVTTTIVPSATTTSTVSTTTTTTSTTTSTATSTTTATVTTTASTTTVYAACATNNLANYYNGSPIIVASQESGQVDGADSFTAATAYDCCVAALTDPNGSSSIFDYLASDQSCLNIYTKECAAAQHSVTYSATLTPDDGGPYYIYGNGYCGEINNSQ